MTLVKIARPELNLVVYNDHSIECRKFNDDGSLGPAKRLYQKTINKIFSHLKGEIKNWKFKGRIPSNVLYVDNKKEIVVWQQKKTCKKLLFSEDKHNGVYALPHMIFKVKGNSLNIVVCKETKDSSIAFLAPFSNTYTSHICLGNASLKINEMKYYEDIIKHAEHQFYNSMFTDLPSNLKHAKNAKEFNYKHLVPHQGFKTLKDFIYA